MGYKYINIHILYTYSIYIHMCIVHHSHSDILSLTSHISTCTYTHMDIYYSIQLHNCYPMQIYYIPYYHIHIYIHIHYIHTHTASYITNTSIHSCVCSPIYIMHTHTESTQQTTLAYLHTVERACMRSSQPSYHIIQTHTRCIKQQSTSYEL